MDTEFESKVLDVVNAWVDPGINPQYHELAKRNLYWDWPTLYKAVDELSGKYLKAKVPSDHERNAVVQDMLRFQQMPESVREYLTAYLNAGDST